MVYLLLGNGFEELEAVTVCDILRRGGVEVKTVSVGEQTVMGAHGIPVTADERIAALPAETPEMVVLPGGMGGVQSVSASAEALALVRRVWEAGGYAAAICAAPTILAALGITDGKRATCYPGLEDRMGSAVMQPGAAAVRDGRVLTGQAPGAAVPFGLLLVETLRGARVREKVAAGLVLHNG